MKHLTDQYYGGNRLKEVGAPIEGTDAANKEYVDGALKKGGVLVYRSLTGTAAKTTSPYWCARWDVADPKVTEYFDGMLVSVIVPVAGNGSYGTALQINELGYKPVVFGLNSMISTRYPVGSVVCAVYNATQTATLYLGNGSQTITGCWQVMDYNSDTTIISNVRRYYSSRLKSTAVLLDYGLVFRKNETHVVPLHSVPAGSSGTDANTSSTSTSKTFTTESFDPFGGIFYYRESKRIDANATLGAATLHIQNGLIDARREFNVTNTTNADKNFIAEREIYLVVDLQPDGTVKLATEGNFLVNPWSQTLPTTNDGHLYILLGVAYDKYRYELLMHHQIYYHDGAMLRMYTGAKIPTKTSELDNDSGFIAGPSASVEDNIPAFGNTSGNLAKDSGVSVRRLWEDVDVLPEMENNSYYIAVRTGLWTGTTTTSHRIISVKDIRKVTITAKTSRSARYAFLRTYTAPSGTDIDTAPDYVSGYTTAKEVPAGETKSVVVPADANYLYVQQSTANYNSLPDNVKFTGIGITEHTGDGSGFVKDDGSVDNSEYLTSNDVSAVAMSGDYNDLENTPTIPSKTSDLNNDNGFITDSDVVLVCTYNPTTRTMDKSPSDIVNAYNSGKFIIATNGDLRYYCYAAKSNLIVFRTLLGGIASSPSTGEATINVLGTRLICYIGDSWYHSGQYILQEQLTSGTNIKTINGNSLLGAGNIEIGNNVFRCQFLYVNGEGSMSDNVTPNDILDAHGAGKIVICDMITDLYSTSTIGVVMMFSAIEDGPAFTGVRDCNGQTICFKIRYDTDEREWVVSTVNIGQSPVQADWNATSGFAQILNKPTIGKVVRVCHLQQNGRLVEDKINPVRTDEELYLVTFDSNTIPSQWIVCDGDTVVDYTVPDVPISTFQQGDVCLFLGKYEIVTNPFTNNTDTSLGLKLLFHSRWGQMLSALQSAAVTIHSGSGIPDDDLGSDGDIYIMTTT